jgi:hypothetical protein
LSQIFIIIEPIEIMKIAREHFIKMWEGGPVNVFVFFFKLSFNFISKSILNCILENGLTKYNELLKPFSLLFMGYYAETLLISLSV